MRESVGEGGSDSRKSPKWYERGWNESSQTPSYGMCALVENNEGVRTKFYTHHLK